MTQYKLVPAEPTEEQWGGLARDIIMWMQLCGNDRMSGRGLHEHLHHHCGKAAPSWLFEEVPETDAALPKGTIAACIYKAMLATAPEINPWVSVEERLPKIDGFYRCAHAPDVYGDSSWNERGFSGVFPADVTHWWDESIMPIPRPKEEKP